MKEGANLINLARIENQGVIHRCEYIRKRLLYVAQETHRKPQTEICHPFDLSRITD